MQKNVFKYYVATLAFIAMAGAIIQKYHFDHANEKADTVYGRVMRTGILRCGYIAWQPFIMKEPNTGKLSGLSYDFFEALGKTLGIKIEWQQEVLVGQQVTDLNLGKIDAVCGDWPLNSVTAKYVDYTAPFVFMPMYLYEKRDGKTFNGMSDINDPAVSISAMDGDISLMVAEEKFPNAKKVTIPDNADPTLINVNVAQGKADLVANDPFSLSYYNANNKVKLVPVLSAQPLIVLKTGGSVKKGEVDFVRMLNEGIEMLIASGGADAILDKYDPEKNMLKRVRLF